MITIPENYQFSSPTYHAGKKEGRLEGESQLLLRLLRRKFGELPEGVEARVRAASEPELLDWSERILTASSLDDVF